jgi:hypothetical protein
MKAFKIRQIEARTKKITLINISHRDCRIVGIGLNLFGIRLTTGFVFHETVVLPEDGKVADVEAELPCRDCDIYEGMFW